MKRLSVLTDGSTAVKSKELKLDDSFITHENQYLLVKKATVFFEF